MEAKAINIHVELINRARENDQEAQFDLYKKYSGAMYNTALRITHNATLAEDVLQEAFLNAFQSLGYYRGDASFGSWLKRIVINKAISLSRKESKWELSDNELGVDEFCIDEDSTSDQYTIDTVKQAIEKLPKGFRTVLSLYLLEGYDHREISEVLNISESTSKTQYKRAKDRLKKMLKEKMNYG